jgi:hypothetical protein
LFAVPLYYGRKQRFVGGVDFGTENIGLKNLVFSLGLPENGEKRKNSKEQLEEPILEN